MTTVAEPKTVQLAPSIGRLVSSLRGQIRRYVFVEGAAAVVTFLGLAFWATLALDWFFEPDRWVRLLLVISMAAGGAILIARLIVARLVRPLPNASLALILERRFPQFRESLLTAVELSGQPHVSPVHEALLRHTNEDAAAHASHLSASDVFDLQPLRKQLVLAAVLCAATLSFAFSSPAALRLWAERMILLSDALWPRQARLEIDGFESGVVKVARGSDLEIVARADTSKPLIPSVVQVRYRMEGGNRDNISMNRLGVADPKRDRYQEYSYTFRGILSSIHFDVVGGDDAVRNLWIQVVESPAVVQPMLECVYPKYMNLPPRTLPITGAMQIPFGTDITLVAKANKDLVSVQIDSPLEEPPPAPAVVTIGDQAADRRGFRYAIGPLRHDKTLALTLLDADGIRNREAMRAILAVVPDEPPKLTLQLRGIGPAVTPLARIPIFGQITDDYGVSYAWYEFTVDQQPPVMRPATIPTGNPIQIALDDGVELRPLALTPGQKLALTVKANDRFNLGNGPNAGSSERWALDVVTPAQLRMMLETREMGLRQRFETIIQEVQEARDLLARMAFGEAAVRAEEKAKTEPDDPSPAASGNPAERALAARQLRVERAIQNGRKNAHEIQGVAESFDDIVLQMVNNRIDTEELMARLRDGIADPLRRVSQQQLPAIERQLEKLRDVLGDERLGPPLRTEVVRQLDALLATLRQVLDRMVELESFNKAIEELRKIIDEQKKLNEQTKQRQKEKLRDLLQE